MGTINNIHFINWILNFIRLLLTVYISKVKALYQTGSVGKIRSFIELFSLVQLLKSFI